MLSIRDLKTSSLMPLNFRLDVKVKFSVLFTSYLDIDFVVRWVNLRFPTRMSMHSKVEQQISVNETLHRLLSGKVGGKLWYS